jgi:hypothetical protein
MMRQSSSSSPGATVTSTSTSTLSPSTPGDYSRYNESIGNWGKCHHPSPPVNNSVSLFDLMAASLKDHHNSHPPVSNNSNSGAYSFDNDDQVDGEGQQKPFSKSKSMYDGLESEYKNSSRRNVAHRLINSLRSKFKKRRSDQTSSTSNNHNLIRVSESSKSTSDFGTQCNNTVRHSTSLIHNSFKLQRHLILDGRRHQP